MVRSGGSRAVTNAASSGTKRGRDEDNPPPSAVTSAAKPVEAPLTELDTKRIERIPFSNFHHHSIEKDNCYVDTCSCTILRGATSMEEHRKMKSDAADAFMYGRRYACEGLPAQSVNLGRFDGRPVLGRTLFDHVVRRMKDEGLIGAGLTATLVGKSELKRVSYGGQTPWELTGSHGIFDRKWGDAAHKAGCDPEQSMTTPPHRDSGVQHQNAVFVRGGGTITINKDPKAVQVR